MADSALALSSNMAQAITSIITKQMETLMPKILKVLRQASNVNSNDMREPNAQNTDQYDAAVVTRPSFKQVLVPPQKDIDDSSEMKAQQKGEYLSIKVDEGLVQNSIAQLQDSLIGKLSLSQGDSPYSLEQLKITLG